MSQAHATKIDESPGWALITANCSWAAYIVVAVTLGAEYEQDIEDAAVREDASINTIAAETMSRIVHDHAAYSVITSVFLLLPVLLFAAAMAQLRAFFGGRLSVATWWSAIVSLVVCWVYIALNLGLLADADQLPVLVRDLDVLTVPMVTVIGLSAVTSLVCASVGLRRAGVVPRASLASVILCGALGLLSVVALVTSGGTEPVPPIVVVPAGLVLGIALVRRSAQSVR